MAKNTYSVLTVFTFRSVERMLREGGSQAWNLDPSNARRCTYLVCCRNRFSKFGAEGQEEHGAAFFVGKISSVEPAPDEPRRFIVRISEYALPDPQPVVWPGSRNPVWYVEQLSDLKIDEATLDWQTMPEGDELGPQEADTSLSADPDSVVRLTIPEAKAGLAATFGVSPENIEIIVRG